MYFRKNNRPKLYISKQKIDLMCDFKFKNLIIIKFDFRVKQKIKS